MPKRRLLLATGASLALVACGFELRHAPKFAFTTLYTGWAEGSALGAEFRRSIAANGDVRLITDTKLATTADVVLEILQEQREKVVVGVTTAGTVREFKLRLRLRFALRGKNGKELIASSEIVQQRDISFNESVVLSKEAEESLLYRNMQSDIVQQLMRRLAAVTSL